MKKGIFFILILVALISFSLEGYSQFQTPNKEFNPLYRPISVVMRLSYDNFKKIKRLHTAIMNYGKGKEEFDKLVDTYAEASALYFQNKIVQSANLFTKNKKEINAVSARIALVYKDYTEKLHTEIIKMNVKYNIKKTLKGEKPNPSTTVAIRSASFGVQKANDYYVRSRWINSIYQYRRVKDSCFKLYEILEVPLPSKFRKDILDNQNQIFISKIKRK